MHRGTRSLRRQSVHRVPQGPAALRGAGLAPQAPEGTRDPCPAGTRTPPPGSPPSCTAPVSSALRAQGPHFAASTQVSPSQPWVLTQVRAGAGTGGGGRAARVTDTCSHPSDCDAGLLPQHPCLDPAPQTHWPRAHLPSCPHWAAGAAAMTATTLSSHPRGPRGQRELAPPRGLSHPPAAPVWTRPQATSHRLGEGGGQAGQRVPGRTWRRGPSH